MNILKVFGALTLSVLAACSGGNDSPVPSVEPDQTQANAVEAQEAAGSGLDPLPVVGGITVTFPHVVASRRDESNTDGSLNRVLRVVYQEVETEQVDSELAAGFRKRGFRAREASAEGSKLTYVVSDGTTRVRYVIIPVGPDLGVELSQDNAKGLVTFYWKE